MGDWSMLSYDILGEIALKLDTFEDFVYLSAVCRSWNHASSLVKRDWKPSMPSLFLAENQKENPDFVRKMYSLSNDRCFQLSLPQTFGSRCWGSACGWIVTIDLSRRIHMLNPFTKARFELPSQPTLPGQDTPLDSQDEYAITDRIFSIRKPIVLKSVEKGRDDDFIVLAIHTNWKRFLAYARPGDQTWTAIVPPWPFEKTPYEVQWNYRAVDIVCRDRLILILYGDGSIGYLDISDLSKSTNLQKSVKAKEFLPYPKTLKDHHTIHDHKQLSEMYLVESFGSLLMVLRNKNTKWDETNPAKEHEYYKTTLFEVFRYNTETKKWEQVKELGDAVLFLGNSQSISLRASDCRNRKSNSIYFADDCDECWVRPEKLGGHDMGVFDLENGEIHKFYEGDDVHSDFCTPFWFMPQF